MCLAALAFDVHPRYALVLLANRDEFHARATQPAQWWDEGILAGRDLQAGGTWLGIDRHGRYALLTNVRDPSRHDPSRPSRGALVPALLADPRPLDEALAHPQADGACYNGFNLVAGGALEAFWMSNHPATTRRLSRGVYGISNAQLDVPWRKLMRTKAVLASWLAEGADDDVEPLFAALADTSLASDAELPATGVTLERERQLSAAFILGSDYGTRSSTIITIGRDGKVRFIERSFDASGAPGGEVSFRYACG